MARFKQDSEARDKEAEDFDTIFYVGGHGPIWDLTGNPDSIALIESFYNSGKPVAAVRHAPTVLHRLTYKGRPMLKGKRVTGFTNSEEGSCSPHKCCSVPCRRGSEATGRALRESPPIGRALQSWMAG